MLFRKRQKPPAGRTPSGEPGKRRRLEPESYLITFDMMEKGAVVARRGRKVRQIAVMVGTNVVLVTSGDKVDRPVYEALVAAGVVRGEQPPKVEQAPAPVVVEAVEPVAEAETAARDEAPDPVETASSTEAERSVDAPVPEQLEAAPNLAAREKSEPVAEETAPPPAEDAEVSKAPEPSEGPVAPAVEAEAPKQAAPGPKRPPRKRSRRRRR